MAVCLLSGYGEYDLLLDIADWRGLMPEVLDEILPFDVITTSQSDNRIVLRQRWADPDTVDLFLELGYDSLITLETNGKIRDASCLRPLWKSDN